MSSPRAFRKDDGRLPKLALRERRKLQTRFELIEAAMSLFVTEGFEATTVDMIADRAGTSVPTFYRYFPSKEDVVFFDAEERLANLRTALQGRNPGATVLSAVRDFCIGEARKRDEGPTRDVLKLRSSVLFSHPALGNRFLGQEFILHEIISEAVANDLGLDARRDTLPRFVAGAVIGPVCSVGWFWYSSEELTKRFAELFDLLEETIGPLLDVDRHSSSKRAGRNIARERRLHNGTTRQS